MNIQIQLLSVTTETKPTAKGSYQQLEVAYKDLSNQGKVSSKKIMSFANKKVFDTLSIAKPAAVFEITMEKDEAKGYWNWIEAKRSADGAATIASVPQGTSVSPATTSTKGGWETPEERAKRQIYIIRQSSLSTAVAALSVGSKVHPNPKDVIDYAKQLESYVFGDSEAKVASKDVGTIETLEEDIPF